MTRLTAGVLGTFLVPLSTFVFFLALNLVVGDTPSNDTASGAAFLPFAFSLPVTAPLGAVLGLVLFHLAARNRRRARLLSFPVGFAAGIIGTYATGLLLSGGRSGGSPAQILTWPLWLYAAVVSYGFAILLTAPAVRAQQKIPGNTRPVAAV
jgi:hypothetical protein